MKNLQVGLIGFVVLLGAAGITFADPWVRHTIDDESKGADGVRLADVDGDGDLDIATGWEEGGVVRAYENPGAERAAKVDAWNAVTVGKVKSAEDAVFADLDGDGSIDVVSACEGRTRTLYAHWAPSSGADYWSSSAWKTEKFPTSEGAQLWMFTLPFDIDGDGHLDLVTGSKGPGATIGWWRSPGEGEKARDLSAWKFKKLCDATWVMSLQAVDMDGDGDDDIVASNRKGTSARILWLENPGGEGEWKERVVGAAGEELMFLDTVDVDEDGELDVVVAAKDRKMVTLTKSGAAEFAYPEAGYGTAKAVRVVDVNGDGALDFVGTTEKAGGPRSGVFWMAGPEWRVTHDIGGPEGEKFDRIEMLDLDGDGDLDLLTCEERDQLGVVWYENPYGKAE
jgi:hypothetical protein